MEKVDEILLRRILECPQSTPTEMLYLELACVYIRFVLMSRRVMFLQYILKESEGSLIKSFFTFTAQLKNPIKNYWVQAVQKSLESLSVNISFDEIEKLSKDALKHMIQTACEYLNDQKMKHSKVQHINHTKWETYYQLP